MPILIAVRLFVSCTVDCATEVRTLPLLEDSCPYVQIYCLLQWFQNLHLKVVLKDNSR